MRTEIIYNINEDTLTVGTFLTEKGYSHNLIDDIKHIKGGLTVNGKEVYTKEILRPGDVLKVKLPEEKNDDWIEPEEIPLDILYEDDDLLVVDKDAGVLVHPTRDHAEGTLAGGLRWYFEQKHEPFTFRVVNRLDQDTSGLLIIPRHALSASILGRELSDHKIKRVYIAVASGDVRDVFPSGEGVIDAPIANVPGEGMLRTVDPERGDKAVTHVRILDHNEEKDVSICAVTLESGRTHQIRVHFKYIGHPLPGDFLYNPDYRFITRQALHSYMLTFDHPITGEMLSFTAPLPADMQGFLRKT